MTLTDEVAMQILQTTNNALETGIDATIGKNNYARRIVLLDQVNHVIPLPEGSSANPGGVYKNYYFGKEAATITSPEQCTIARGSSGTITLFGRSIRAEANAAYDVNMVEPQLAPLTTDTDTLVSIFKSAAYACFAADGTPKLDAYYGGNSFLRISGTAANPLAYLKNMPSGTNLT